MIALYGPQAGHWAAPAETLTAMPVGENITLFFIGLFSAIAAPDVWQRIYSARSAKAARKSMAALIVLMTLFLVLQGMLGMVVKGMGIESDANHVATHVFKDLVPVWLMPVAILAFMAAIMSTVATALFGGAMCLASDVARELGWIGHDDLQLWCRRIMLAMLAAGLGLAALRLDLIDLTLACFGVCMVFTPIVAVSQLDWRVSERAAFGSLAVSLGVFLVGVYFNIYTGLLGLAPVAVATVTLVLFEAISRRLSAPRAELQGEG
jgi:SSS family solute:Na+ symporter